MAIIKTTNLCYIYSQGTPFEKKALNNINLEINNNDFIGIIGHTGSGKSTLIQHFNGLLKPSSGNIFIDGKNIWEDKNNIYNYRFKVGVSFQYPEYQLFEETIFKDIAFGPSNMGLSNEEIYNRVHWAMNIVGLSKDYCNISPFQLSGGQKRKVALAGIIAMDPSVLILDEPTAGLDPQGKKIILQNINKYYKEKKNTIILISHNMDDIAKYCNSVIILNQSQLYFHGSTQEAFSKLDQLSSIGLEPPDITKLFHKLHSMYRNIPSNIYIVEQAIKEIKKLI